jgi:enoyl-CoA hydratase/carnithine racemase
VKLRSAYELQEFDLQNRRKGGHHRNQSTRGEECLELGDLDGVGKCTETVKAEEAEGIGLVHRVVPCEKLMEGSLALAKETAKGSAGTHIGKRSMFQAFQNSYQEAVKIDSEPYGEVCKTEDFKEGVTAFLEKRKPMFKNR